MHAIERAEHIMTALQRDKVVVVTELSHEMQVTEETVRKDLEKLENQGKLHRVHGGAYLNDGFGNETPYAVRSRILRAEKDRIGRQCLKLVREQEPVFLDASTTAASLARALAESRKRLIVITNSLEVVKILEAAPQIRLVLLGGEFDRAYGAFEGSSVIMQLRQYYIQTAFLSGAGISLEAGMTDSAPGSAEIRRAVIERASRRVLMADMTKIGRNGPYVIGELGDVDCLVSDGSVEAKDQALYEKLLENEAEVMRA
ncbi:DeoR/GlpR transcriptional regulator [Oribacterium sp. oral taxon 102]|uniref:DeoR/GlpR family DNA-binding transcription regulator n=1 Tax=Oribacterium sp. oral taxon 102 TaxID=671214 RepID=UPI0015BD8B45|nr:DeoR/GlpR family DNA-binding transcription regulator [Oribacterium sp. oral taxon 102]NWO22097.1 DeoR/GlpR transcriptional regulator [Oribacterium sp. oral taxon 102]